MWRGKRIEDRTSTATRLQHASVVYQQFVFCLETRHRTAYMTLMCGDDTTNLPLADLHAFNLELRVLLLPTAACIPGLTIRPTARRLDKVYPWASLGVRGKSHDDLEAKVRRMLTRPSAVANLLSSQSPAIDCSARYWDSRSYLSRFLSPMTELKRSSTGSDVFLPSGTGCSGVTFVGRPAHPTGQSPLVIFRREDYLAAVVLVLPRGLPPVWDSAASRCGSLCCESSDAPARRTRSTAAHRRRRHCLSSRWVAEHCYDPWYGRTQGRRLERNHT